MRDMATTDAAEDVGRVPLNLRVDEEVKSAFEETVREKYGTSRPYGGLELEREFRFRLDDGTLAEVWETVDALADAFGQAGRKEKNLSTDRDETVVVRYRVAEHIRDRIMSFASEHDYRSAGAFVESIMWWYANGEGVEERIAGRLNRIQDAADRRIDSDLSATERRTKTIADSLANDGGNGFSMGDFEEAVKAAKGINSTRYVRKEYLPRVLDELGFTWHPNAEGHFVDEEIVDAEHRDPRAKPYILMDDEDRREALRYAVYRKDILASGKNTTTVSLDEAPAELGASPQLKTIRSDFQAIDGEDGFTYVSRDDDRLAINRQNLAASTREELQAIASAEGLIDTGESADDENNQADEEPRDEQPAGESGAESWVDAVVSSVRNIPFDEFEDAEQVDKSLAGKIAIHKYADAADLDDDGTIPDKQRRAELQDMVTDDDLDAVRRELDLEPTTELSRDEIEEEFAAEFEALESADRARADGGRRIEE